MRGGPPSPVRIIPTASSCTAREIGWTHAGIGGVCHVSVGGTRDVSFSRRWKRSVSDEGESIPVQLLCVAPWRYAF